MGEEKKRRRRRDWWWFDVFDDFERIQKRMAESFKDMFEELPKTPSKVVRTPFGEERVFGPYISGFSIELGPDGAPRIRTFGNIKRKGVVPQISEEREPLVDVYEEKDKVKVIAELPGVEKKDIDVKVVDDKLILSTSKAARKYHKEVALPARVDVKKVKATYNNGILTLELPRVEEKKKGKSIQID